MIETPTLAKKQSTSLRKRVWHSKTTTGCQTCKTRKVKCDETRPICLRCKKAGRICEGYLPPRKAWIFDPESPSSSSSTSSGESSFIDVEDTTSPSQDVLHLPRTLSGPYKHKDEQYFLKYFLEVTAPALARSEFSGPFWMKAFPQVAWHLKGTRYALLAMSMGFDETSKDLFASLPVQHYQINVLDYETRAMSSVVKESPSMEGVLVTSMAFWIIALISGDFARSVQHCYFAQKVLHDLKQPQKYNPLVLKYCALISRAGLDYFRATRGPCPLHLSPDPLDCEASCFVPENHALGIRVANILHHLRKAWIEYTAVKQLLNNRTQPHSRGAMLLEMLDKTLREIRFLTRRWSDHDHLELPSDFEATARPLIPFTTSPFRPMLDGLWDYIENDQASSVSFGYLELQMRTAHPMMCIDTSREIHKVIADLAFILFHGSIWDNKMRTGKPMKEELVKTMMRDWTTVEEQSLQEAADELRVSQSVPP